MLTDKEAKKKYREEFFKNPEKYYATEFLKNEGFLRKLCSKCRKPFWSTDSDRKICGDPTCGDMPFSFIGSTPAKKKMDYTEVWKRFSRMFEKFGYTPIKRYPVVARWNPTLEYTNASIAAFQPYVVSGEAEPPAKRLVIPQLCFRAVDIDNIGITGSHNTVFCMIGQHAFVQPKEWDQNLVFEHIHAWLKSGLGLPNEEITFHEDAWAGGGNLGPCMEFFSRGNELGNQVYMMYEQTDTGIRGLNLKVLDMGMGQERNAWFSQGVNTIYDATFPAVIEHLLKLTGLKFNRKVVAKYVPYGGLLNLDEVDDINKAWSLVAQKSGFDIETLKNTILPLAGLYSIAEHSRALLVMFSDGALPSNVGDSYNLRIILRRMLGFIDKYDWDVDIHKLFELHAKYLKPQYPELMENLDGVKKIFDVEKEKYGKTKEKSKQMISRLVNRDIGLDELLQLYDSHGIPPDMIASELKKFKKTVVIPDNFYALVSEMHEKQEQKHATRKSLGLDFGIVPATKPLYFDDYRKKENTAKVMKIFGNSVVLDQTVAYPTSGGQMHDNGTINGEEFTDVFKQGSLIIHQMKSPPRFKEGDDVKVEIDILRRLQLAKHHTATHIVNEACRRVLGNHVNQASAFKDADKAHLDITHYASIDDKELSKIEKIANQIVKKAIKINKTFMKRSDAEQKHGMRIYQGGSIPGKELRIVDINGIDIEACGGTHLNNTSEADMIVILSTERIQDNISRITFVAGPAAYKIAEKYENIIKESSRILGTTPDNLFKATNLLVKNWKKSRKTKEKEIVKSSANVMGEIAKEFTGQVAIKVLHANLNELKEISRQVSSRYKLLILLGLSDGKTFVWVASIRGNAGIIAKEICGHLGGKGGGSNLLGQGFGRAATQKDLEFVRQKYIEASADK